jgi:hypothetical protein
MAQASAQEELGAKHRRSQRLLLQMPVFVQGEAEDARVFVEETKTLVVNAHDALIALSRKVAAGRNWC